MQFHPFTGPSWLAALAPYPTWSEALVFQLNGLVVVFIALGLIWGAMEVVGWFFKRMAPPNPVDAAAAPPAAPPAAVSPSAEIDAHTLAVIAAAVHVTLGGRYRIRAVTTGDVNVTWAQEARRQIFASHKVR